MMHCDWSWTCTISELWSVNGNKIKYLSKELSKIVINVIFFKEYYLFHLSCYYILQNDGTSITDHAGPPTQFNVQTVVSV